MNTDTQDRINALNVMLSAARLAPLNYQDHLTINRAYETLMRVVNPPPTISEADEEAARV